MSDSVTAFAQVRGGGFVARPPPSPGAFLRAEDHVLLCLLRVQRPAQCGERGTCVVRTIRLASLPDSSAEMSVKEAPKASRRKRRSRSSRLSSIGTFYDVPGEPDGRRRPRAVRFPPLLCTRRWFGTLTQTLAGAAGHIRWCVALVPARVSAPRPGHRLWPSSVPWPLTVPCGFLNVAG